MAEELQIEPSGTGAHRCSVKPKRAAQPPMMIRPAITVATAPPTTTSPTVTAPLRAIAAPIRSSRDGTRNGSVTNASDRKALTASGIAAPINSDGRLAYAPTKPTTPGVANSAPRTNGRGTASACQLGAVATNRNAVRTAAKTRSMIAPASPAATGRCARGDALPRAAAGTTIAGQQYAAARIGGRLSRTGARGAAARYGLPR